MFKGERKLPSSKIYCSKMKTKIFPSKQKTEFHCEQAHTLQESVKELFQARSDIREEEHGYR